MSRRRVASRLGVLFASVQLLACSDGGGDGHSPALDLDMFAPGPIPTKDEPMGAGGAGEQTPAETGEDQSLPLEPPLCGNGIWEQTEVCDPNVGGFESCMELGFDGGVSSCSPLCALDLSGCFYEVEPPRPEDVCGDGYVDDGEDCEDGNTEDGDGCDAGCNLEASENEPNDTELESDPWTPGAPYYGMLTPGDADWLSLTIEEDDAPASLVASVSDLLIEGCSEEAPGINPALELLDSLGDPVAWDSDGGPGDCPLLEVNDLEAGTYYLGVVSEMSGSFPYALELELN